MARVWDHFRSPLTKDPRYSLALRVTQLTISGSPYFRLTAFQPCRALSRANMSSPSETTLAFSYIHYIYVTARQRRRRRRQRRHCDIDNLIPFYKLYIALKLPRYHSKTRLPGLILFSLSFTTLHPLPDGCNFEKLFRGLFLFFLLTLLNVKKPCR